jgi:hypothetical protein
MIYLKINKIKYIGEDIYAKESSIFFGKKLLTKNKIYNLAFIWTGTFLNDHWVFYIFDDLDDGDYRGYELHKDDIMDLRELNLSILGI